MKKLAALVLLPLVLVACNDVTMPVEPMSADGALLSKGQPKSVVCHRNDQGGYHAIEIAAPAVPAHMAHGDGTPGSALTDHSGTFTADCDVSSIVLDGATTVYTGLGGGGGGSPFDDPCPAGSVVVGLSGDRANYFGHAVIWSHRVECRELRGDGTLGASSSTPSRGPIFNIPPIAPYTAICASDELLTGINGDNHSLVNSIAGSCTPLATILANGPPNSSIGPFVGFGFGFLATYSLPCPAGYVATGTFGSAGDVLDSVGLRCTKVVIQTS